MAKVKSTEQKDTSSKEHTKTTEIDLQQTESKDIKEAFESLAKVELTNSDKVTRGEGGGGFECVTNKE